jgi:hypothetical protein
MNASSDPNVDEAITKVFTNYFADRTIISIGSFIRKVNSLLMDLCDTLQGLWTVVLRYDAKGEKFRFIIRNVDNHVSYDITCALADGVNYNGAITTVNTSFNRDKIAKHPVTHLLANIMTNRNDYVFEKKLLTSAEDIAVWTMVAVRKSWFKKLFAKRDPLKARVIKSIKVVQYKL